MQRAAWARWRSRVYVTPDVFRIALSKFHPIFAQIGHLPQILRQPREIPKYGTYLPLGPYRTGGLLPPLWGTPMCMVPMDLHKRRKGEEAGLLWLGLAARRVKARPSWARWRRAAGVTAPAQVTKVKTPFFNDLRGMTSLSIRLHFAFIIIVLQRAACRVQPIPSMNQSE